MSKIKLEIHDDVVETLERIKEHEVAEIELEIPEGSVLFDNSITIKLLLREAEKLEKTLSFITDDENGQNILSIVDSGGSGASFDGFASKEVPLSDIEGSEEATKKPKKKLKRPSISLPKLSFPKFSFKWPLILIFVLILLGGVGYFTIWTVPKAEVKIIVNSQPLIKSLTLKIVKDTDTNAEQRILKGETITAAVSDSMTIDTTGEKIVGDKAEGTIIIYNRTDTEQEFKKGTTVTFKDSDEDLNFVLEDNVTVPAESLEDPLDLTSPSIPGQAEVDVVAADIGESYNIDDDETLEFEDYKKSEFFAKSKDSFSGGNSDTVKVVAQEDLDKLSEELVKSLTESSLESLEKKLGSGKKQIPGSQEVQVSSEDFSAEVDDEEDEITLTQVASATVLTYSEKELDNILDALVEELIPEGFVLSDKEREVNVEILGNSDDTTLSITEADLQVTLKSFVMPEVDEKKIVNELAGKSLVEAEKVLGGIRNVDTYKLEISPSIPFLQRVPQNIENISITVERK